MTTNGDEVGARTGTDGHGDGLTGLERLRAGLASSGSRVPFADLVKMRIDDVGPGHITVLADFPAWLDTLLAASLPGPLATLADGTLGHSILTRLPAGRVSVTSQLRVDFVGPISPTPGPWSCHAVCDYVTAEVGLSRGKIRNGNGEVVALSTMWAAVIDAPPPVPSSTSRPAGPVPSAAESLGSGSVNGSAAPILELSICHELDIACLEATEGRARLRVPPADELANSVGSMHGGAIALLGDFTGAVALSTLRGPHSADARRLWTQIDYLRPIRMTGTTEFAADLSWRSRRVAMVEGEVTAPGATTAARIRQASLI